MRKLWMIGGAVAFLAMPAWADDDPSLRIKNKVDEEFRVREDVGVSKARTMGQSDIDKDLNSSVLQNVRVHATLRASYDAAYDMNARHFGNSAGGSVSFQNNGPGFLPGGGTVAWGQGLNQGSLTALTNGLFPPAGAAGAIPAPAGPNPFHANQLGFNLATNPNSGLMIVDGWASQDHGIALATPVRPCNIDNRGCIKGYMDFNTRELAAPEFNERLDFLRELYVDGEIPSGSNTLAVRVGRQQLVWGRTDLFHVLDVVNPVDYSRNNIYDENSDIRIPMGMIRADYRMGARGAFDDLNAQLVWVFEPWRPNNLGQAGSTNNPLGAAQLFRGLKNCWDNGCTVANFAGGALATDFGPHQIGIRQANTPDYKLGNTTFGGKVEGELGGVGFSLNALHYVSPMPSLHGAQPSNNSFGPFAGGPNNTSYPTMIAFDIDFPQVNLIGGSLDFNIEPVDTAIRMEAVMTHGEEFADTAQRNLYKESGVVRYVIGADRPTFIRFLNPNRAFLISGQMFGQHINDHELKRLATGTVGMPDFQDNWIATLLIKGWYEGDTLSPQVIFARDFGARANVIEPSVEWTPTARWRFRLGANVKFGDYRTSFDDDHGYNPYLSSPNALPGLGGFAGQGAAWGFEPLGRFKDGILGMAHSESELFGNVTLRF